MRRREQGLAREWGVERCGGFGTWVEPQKHLPGAGQGYGSRFKSAGSAWRGLDSVVCAWRRRSRVEGEREEQVSGRERMGMSGCIVLGWGVEGRLKGRMRAGVACARGKDRRERERDSAKDNVPTSSSSVPTHVCPPPLSIVLIQPLSLPPAESRPLRSRSNGRTDCASCASARAEASMERPRRSSLDNRDVEGAVLRGCRGLGMNARGIADTRIQGVEVTSLQGAERANANG